MPTPCQWTARVWREFRAGNLTRSARDVLLTLRTFRGSGGLCVPSHATLAERAKCSVRTVQRALRQADHLGLVRWTERRVRAAWRWLRTSNRYLFEIPETPVAAGMRLRRRTTGQPARGGESGSKKEVLMEMLRAAAALPDLLARRREAMLRRVSQNQG
jgi:AraC-like DNA-binding protein